MPTIFQWILKRIRSWIERELAICERCGIPTRTPRLCVECFRDESLFTAQSSESDLDDEAA